MRQLIALVLLLTGALRVGLPALALSIAIVGCGGGGEDNTVGETADPAAEAERAQALGLHDKLPVSWSHTSLEFSLERGARRDVKVTLTTKVALRNARIVFVPDLRNVVTVSPEAITSLAAGQSAEVTLSFAPKTSDTRKLVAGVLLLFDRNATVSRPLIVKVRLEPPSTAVLLPGNPADQAIDHVLEYDADAVFPISSIERDLANGGGVLRTKLVLGFASGSTVGQVNALLQSLQATIVRAYAATAVLELRIPDPGSLQALNTLLASVRTSPIVGFAFAAPMYAPMALPRNLYEAPPETLKYVAHHLAIKAGPAWNARRAPQIAATPLAPVLMVLDGFGQGGFQPASRLGATLIGNAGTGYTTWTPGVGHGYHVVGIAAASFNAADDSSDTDPISGLYASTKPVLLEIDDLGTPTSLSEASCHLVGFGLVDSLPTVCKLQSSEERLRGMLRRYEGSSRKMIVNTSLGLAKADPLLAEYLKLYWLRLLRGGFGEQKNPIEDRFIQTAAAGNDATVLAKHGSGWNKAAIDGPLTNTLVVESRTAGIYYPFIAPCATSHFSSRGGNISAIGSLIDAGTGVWSYSGPFGEPAQDFGTSMAAPQVAGLAASFWAIRPDFSSSELLGIIQAHAVADDPIACSPPDGKPVGAPLIDAYATILAADDPDALAGTMGNPSKAPARLAILDLDEDGQFTFDDANAFIDAFVAANGAATIGSGPVQTRTVGGRTFDLTRFDLNGDGNLGGDGPRPFNLDINYSAGRKSDYGTATFTTKEGMQVELNERATTDLQVLCYYANSPLWRVKNEATIAEFDSYLESKGLSCTPPLYEIKITSATCTMFPIPFNNFSNGLALDIRGTATSLIASSDPYTEQASSATTYPPNSTITEIRMNLPIFAFGLGTRSDCGNWLTNVQRQCVRRLGDPPTTNWSAQNNELFTIPKGEANPSWTFNGTIGKVVRIIGANGVQIGGETRVVVAKTVSVPCQ